MTVLDAYQNATTLHYNGCTECGFEKKTVFYLYDYCIHTGRVKTYSTGYSDTVDCKVTAVMTTCTWAAGWDLNHFLLNVMTSGCFVS